MRLFWFLRIWIGLLLMPCSNHVHRNEYIDIEAVVKNLFHLTSKRAILVHRANRCRWCNLIFNVPFWLQLIWFAQHTATTSKTRYTLTTRVHGPWRSFWTLVFTAVDVFTSRVHAPWTRPVDTGRVYRALSLRCLGYGSRAYTSVIIQPCMHIGFNLRRRRIYTNI